MTANYAIRLSDKGRSLMTALHEAERELASIWREPFETYSLEQRFAWVDRQVQAARVYLALQHQI